MHLPPRLIALLASLALVPFQMPQAAIITSSASGNWEVGGNWVGGVAPHVGGSTGGAGADSAIINGHALSITTAYAGGDFDVKNGNSITINGGGSVTDNHNNGTWNRIGDSSTFGTVNINNGTYALGTAGPMRTGISGGTGNINVGDGLAGAAVLNTNAKGFDLAVDTTGRSTVTIASDGTWVGGAGGTANIGMSGQATFNLNGGTVDKASGDINVASGATGAGTINISGGTFGHAGSTFRVGQNGGGTLLMSAGTFQKSGNVEFASATAGTGTLVMSNNSVFRQTSGDFYFGYNGVATATLSNNAQIIHDPTNWFWLSRDNGTARMTLNDNAKVTSAAGNFMIGADYHGGAGDGTPSHGTLTVNNSAFVDYTNAGGGFRLGYATNGNGTVNLTGGTVRSQGIAEVGRAGNGTVNLSGGIFRVDGSTLTLGATGSGRGTIQQTGGTLQANTLNVGSGGSTGGTYRLEAGTLRVTSVNVNAANSVLSWGGATIANHTPGILNSAGGTTDYTQAPVFTGPVVRTGDTIAFSGNLASGYNGGSSTLDLGGLYLDSGVRVDRLTVNGTLDLSAANDVLDLNGTTPYLLRPFGFFTEDYGSIPLVSATTLTGTFDTFLAPNSDSRPWSLAGAPLIGGAVLNPSTLAVDTYQLQYTGNQLYFHYRVSGTVPEPGSFALMGIGAWMLRMARRRTAA